MRLQRRKGAFESTRPTLRKTFAYPWIVSTPVESFDQSALPRLVAEWSQLGLSAELKSGREKFVGVARFKRKLPDPIVKQTINRADAQRLRSIENLLCGLLRR